MLPLPNEPDGYDSFQTANNILGAESLSEKDSKVNLPGFCSSLPIGISAASIWTQQQETILQATSLSDAHLPWMRRLLVTLTPDVLEQGLIVLPWLEKLRTTFKPLLRNETLLVAVMGGSVAEGRGCEVLPRAELAQYRNKSEPKVDSRHCTWVHRLQLLADAFHLPIQIFNLATGGTNSFLALPVLEYQLYHSDLLKERGGPHVVINAYAPNDALYSWSWDTVVNNATAHYDHYHETWTAASQFVSAAASSCQQKPFVMFVNDYYGNHHDRLLAEDIRHDAVRQVAQDSGNMYVSPVTAIRPFVLGNTRETLFSPPWWTRKQKGRPLERKRDAHFGMPGHIAVTWMLAYSLLRVAMEYCEHERHQRQTMRESASSSGSDVPPIMNTSPLPLPTPWNTTFVEWQERMQQRKLPVQECSKNGPCLFAFVANPAGTHRLRGKLANYIATYEVSNTGWQAEDDIRNGWQNKLGLCAHSVGAELVLEFQNITQPVKIISLHSLKSYGPEWENSTAHFHVTIRHSSVTIYNSSFEITGFHNQTTSLTYPFQLELPAGGAIPGTDLEIRMTLVQGSNFKITSLLLCDR
jgi:hypothetical protein